MSMSYSNNVQEKFYFRRNRKYSSKDLNVFRYSFKISPFIVQHLSSLGILRKKIKRRGCSSGVFKNRNVHGESRAIGRICNLIDRESVNKSFGRCCVRNNLINIENQVLKYCYPDILFANCRSMRNKFDELSAIVFLKSPDIAVFVETWLAQSDVDAYGIKGYRAIHAVRNRMDKKHGGGVSLYVKENVSILSIRYPENGDLEILTILIRTNNMQRSVPFIAIIAVYSPPLNIYADINICYVLSEIDRIKSINAEADIFVIGDFNDLEIDSRLKRPLFKQIIKLQTCNERLVDKCFYSGRVEFSVKIDAPIATSDHRIVMLSPVNYIKKSDNSITFRSRPRRNSCYRTMGRVLSEIQWDNILNIQDCDIATETFHELIVKCYEESFPIVVSKRNVSDRSWFNWQIRNAIKSRNNYYDKNELDQYRDMNKKVKELICCAKRKEYAKFAKAIENKSLNLYEVVNKYTDNVRHNQGILFPGMDEINSIDWAASFYSDILNKFKPLATEELPAYLPGFEIKPITEAFIYTQLRKIKATVSSAPDGVPNFILREYALELSYPLANIMNKALTLGYCPNIWKKNFLILLPKKKIIESPSDLRPIVLSSSLVKIVEKHIAVELLAVIHDKIDCRQFGGLPGRSPEHYLTFYLDCVQRNLDVSNKRVTAIITDFNKAFDAVDHNLFMRKLLLMDTPPMICKFISSFLMNRSLMMKWNNNITDTVIQCSNGAPQGSVLGGLIFTITVNEIASSWESRMKFVDDLTVLCVESAGDDGSVPQQIVDSICSDSSDSRMSLNAKKCQYMVHCFARSPADFELKIGSDTLTRVNQCKIIGVTLQANLRWDSHVSTIINSANKKFYILYKLRNVGMSIPLLTKVYYTYIRPSLEFCSVVWTNSLTKQQIRDLEHVQRRVVRIIMGNKYIDYEKSLLEVGLETLEYRRLSIFKRYASGFLSTYPEFRPVSRLQYSGRPTRAASKLCIPKCRTERYKSSPVPKMIEAVNRIL